MPLYCCCCGEPDYLQLFRVCVRVHQTTRQCFMSTAPDEWDIVTALREENRLLLLFSFDTHMDLDLIVWCERQAAHGSTRLSKKNYLYKCPAKLTLA